jgi:hypothetical protein
MVLRQTDAGPTAAGDLRYSRTRRMVSLFDSIPPASRRARALQKRALNSVGMKCGARAIGNTAQTVDPFVVPP